MKVLVTGATGFLGKAVVAFLALEHEVFALARQDAPPGLASRVAWHKADLSSPSLARDLDRSLPPDLEAVIHLAGVVGAGAEVSPELLRVTNVRATETLAGWARARRVGRFLFASTGGVYGYRREAVAETAQPTPRDPYAQSKADAEAVCQRILGPAAVLLRLYFPYGPGQPKQRLIPRLIASVRERREITVYNGGAPRLNPIYLDDAVAFVGRALVLPGVPPILHLAGTEVVSISDLAGLIGELLGIAPVFRHEQDPAISNLIANTSLTCRALHLRPSWTLRQGLAETIRAVEDLGGPACHS